MSILESIQSEVNQIVQDRGFVDNRAFAYWFLEEIDEFSMEESEELVTDGPWDGGRDAVYFDEENHVLRIYQFKYSQNPTYISDAFSDIQRAVLKEQDKLKDLERLEIIVACLSTSNDELEEQKKKAQRHIRSFLKKNQYKIECVIDLYDLRKFSQLSDKLIGVDLTISYSHPPLESDSTILGLVDARSFSKHLGVEELFAFNIRKFLGIKRGSVNHQIKETLEDESQRADFWKLNNGIVCLSTDWKRIGENEIAFKDLTIVNGAQTISTIGSYLADNQAFTDPVFVVSKIVKVGVQDIETASMLTKTSNSQTPASNKDLRAVDKFHKTLVNWFQEYENVDYLYRRGDKAKKGQRSIKMKDIAQAYVACVMEEPHIAFARPGKIFVDSEYYEKVFPEDEIAKLIENGEQEDIKAFVRDRLVSLDILEEVRAYLKKECVSKDDLKWKSLAYHLSAIYTRFVRESGKQRLSEIYGSQQQLVQSTIAKLFDFVRDVCDIGKVQVPKILKTSDFAKHLDENNAFGMAKMKKIQEECLKILQ